MKFSTILVATAAILGADAATISAYSGTSYTGTAFSTSRSGTHILGFTAASYRFASSPGDGCCLKTCAGSRETGSFCGSRSNAKVASGNRFNKVVLGCGSTVLNC